MSRDQFPSRPVGDVYFLKTARLVGAVQSRRDGDGFPVRSPRECCEKTLRPLEEQALRSALQIGDEQLGTAFHSIEASIGDALAVGRKRVTAVDVGNDLTRFASEHRDLVDIEDVG